MKGNQENQNIKFSTYWIMRHIIIFGNIFSLPERVVCHCFGQAYLLSGTHQHSSCIRFLGGL